MFFCAIDHLIVSGGVKPFRRHIAGSSIMGSNAGRASSIRRPFQVSAVTENAEEGASVIVPNRHCWRYYTQQIAVFSFQNDDWFILLHLNKTPAKNISKLQPQNKVARNVISSHPKSAQWCHLTFLIPCSPRRSRPWSAFLLKSQWNEVIYMTSRRCGVEPQHYPTKRSAQR